VPVLKFRAVRPLTQDEWEIAKAQSLTDDAKMAIEFKMVPSRAETGTPVALPETFKEAPMLTEAPTATTEPVKRASKKAADAPPPPPKDVASVLADWGTDD